MQYIPTIPPEDSPLSRWMFEELLRIAQRTQEQEDLLRIGEKNAAPEKPRTGDIRLADGTNWDPGTGRGIYWYDEDSGLWTKL